jgi:hypothetical protein
MTNALEHTNASLVVAGPPGIGKTPFALTSPDPYLLNVEAGLQSVAHLQVPTTRITSMADLLEIRNVLALPADERKEILGFDVGTVIIDTIDEVSRIAAHERMKAEQKTEMGPGDWGWLADELNALVRGFRSLDMNLILVTHTKDQQNGETGEISHKPDISGAFGHQLPAAVDIVGLIERRAVFGEGEEAVNKTFFVTDNRRGYDWLKNRGRLPDVIEMNFEDDFKCIHETFFSGVEYAELDVKVINFQAEEVDPQPEPPAAPVAHSNKTVEEVRDQINAASEVVQDATSLKEKKKQEEARPVLTQPLEEVGGDLDLSNCYEGEGIEDTRFKGGFKLLADGTLRNAPGTRFVYKLEDGTRVLSVNQLEKGVKPIPNPELGTGIYCQVTGVEVSSDQANVSRVKFRKVFSESEFEKKLVKEPS